MIMKYLKSLALGTVMLITLSSLSGCGNSNTASTAAATVSMTTPLAVYSSEDMDDSWTAAGATAVTLNGSLIAVNGSGTTVAGSTLTITAPGTYVFYGTLADGQIIVDAGKNDTVRLVLNGATLACSDSAAIYTKQAGKTIITLAQGTNNSVTDGTTYSNAAGADEPDAAIFSKNDLTINGSGSLTVIGNFNNGIGTKDDLVITGGNINITAANDGLRGRDSVAANDGIITINAKSDGIQANNDEDTTKGWISLDGGTFNITADQDGIQAETILQITRGEFSLTTGGGSANALAKNLQDPGPGRGVNNTAATEESTASTKGIKAGSGILISNGVIKIDSADDAIHSQGDVTIAGGTFNIATGDDAVHGDANVTIGAGSIAIAKSYEGLEGMTVTINGGEIHLVASDDGINAAGGSNGDKTGQDNFSSSGDNVIRITDGCVYVDAGGDGIDSNGDVYFDGGTVIVNGPTNNGNGPLDYNGKSEITGGILVAAGSSGMAQAPNSSSPQNSLLVYYSSTQKAGTLVNLTDDESGKSLLTFAPAKDYQSIVISMPELAQGKTYTLSSGGSSTGDNVNGLYSGGTYSSGTKLTNITISGTLTSISDDGSQVSGRGSMGGVPGGQGGPSTMPPSR